MSSAMVLHRHPSPGTGGDTGDRDGARPPGPLPWHGSRWRRAASAMLAALTAAVAASDDPAWGVRVGVRRLDDPCHRRPGPDQVRPG